MMFKKVIVKILKWSLYPTMLFLLLSQMSCGLGYFLDSEPKELSFPEKEAVEKEVETWDNSQKPPILITGGLSNNVFYAGLPNDVKVHIEGGNTEHLYVYSTSGQLSVVDKAKGHYSFLEQVPGFVVEIIAEDTVTGVRIFTTFNVIGAPAPTAYVWKLKTPINTERTVGFKAEQFIEQNILILQHDLNIKVPARCAAISYNIIRIDDQGQKTTCENNGKSGMFTEDAKKLVAAAKKGDIYIFKDIKTDCSSFPVKDVVYILK